MKGMFSLALGCEGCSYDPVCPDMSGQTGIQRVPSTAGIRSPICAQIFLFCCWTSTHETQPTHQHLYCRQGSALYCILWCDQALWLFFLCTCECFLAGVVFHYMVTVYSETIRTICVCTFVVFNIHCCLRLQQQWDQLLVATQSSVVQRRQPSHRYRLCAKIHTSIYAV